MNVESAGHSAIPADLLARLERYPALRQNGTLVRRREQGRRPVWRLRCRLPRGIDGRRRQLAIAVGTGSVVVAVQLLLRHWRRAHRLEQQAHREAQRARKAQERQERQNHQRRRRQVQMLAGGGRRRRRRVGCEFDRACQQGTGGALAYLLAEEYLRPNHPGGRPGKSGLVL